MLLWKVVFTIYDIKNDDWLPHIEIQIAVIIFRTVALRTDMHTCAPAGGGGGAARVGRRPPPPLEN